MVLRKIVKFYAMNDKGFQIEFLSRMLESP